jgi:hypothetical protein
MSDLTILEIVQEAIQTTGLSKPSSLIGNGDRTATLALSLLKREVNRLARKTQWQNLQREVSFLSLAQEDQGAIATIMPNMAFIINDTIWNRDLKRPVFGPLSPQLQAQNKAFYQAGPWNQFYIREGHLWFYPKPAADQSIYIQYVSKAVGRSALDVEILNFSLDTDVPYGDDEALILGIRWRFLAKNELSYGQEKDDYDECVNNLIARDSSKGVLSMDGVKYDIMPGIFIPSGSWSL